ncbi:MAG TPA: hypothetical protein VGZ90_14555 [Puia sp.]|jgi:hypothetical protein|nr:hypothetical protein [Puia sp.]
MLTYFLFFIYLFSGTILLHIIIRRYIFPFSIYHTMAILFFKIFMGCLYGWVFLHYYGGDDTWNYFNESKVETGILIRHPLQFINEFLPSYSLKATDYHYGKAILFYIDHFERWFLIKGLAFLNLLSGKNYYINVLWFEFLTIPGPLLLFKLLTKEFPLRSGMNFLLVFFIPSVIFWCSGIRAEGLLLLFMVLMIYNGKAYARKPGIMRALGILAGFTGLLLLRYQFLLVFLPAFLAYSASLGNKESSPLYFNRIYIMAALIFLASLFLPPAFQLSRPVQNAQESFFRLVGNTRYQLDSLKPGPLNFIKVLPQAAANSILRPYPWEGKNLLQSISSVDVLFLIAGLIYFFASPRYKEQINHPVFWLFLFYALSQLIGIGLAVPFPGAIVRYRSIAFLLLALFLYAGNPHMQQKLRYWIFNLH